MATSFKLNKELAGKVGRSDFIQEKGAYIGTFVRAEYVESTKKTKGIEFDFKTNDGQTARYLTVWYENSKGEQLGGGAIIHAMMACVGAREINPVEATIKKWSSESRAEENFRGTVFPELMNKPIGVVMCREEYVTSNGQATKWKMTLVCPYEAATGRTALERLANTNLATGETGDLEKILHNLKDRPLRPQSGGGGFRPKAADATGSGFEDMDDDLPF
jgi:hypothetical protein